MRKIPVPFHYEARGENDTTEGRGGSYLVGLFAGEEDAKRAVLNLGVMGTPGRVLKKEESYIVIYDTFEEFASSKLDQLRMEALAKLTAEERKALGL